ncbi:methyl-accepting chemotaxis protein [Aquabacterium sp.]|uniref:methyl-accepting chemotaxis protein n=1 Tax=Aquabacterium sp. TaxID=1872578 RepID=UPI002E315A74|nr:methyl-accepting chemotaxis protein [Aquabacterium sp.]HEX5312380.1 methyl-accepting chemotaxis protein [Aquabacterium sp.]
MIARIARLLHVILTPGLYLMRRMKLPAKLALLTGVMALPLLVLLVLVVTRTTTDMRIIEREIQGSDLASRMFELTRMFQSERGLILRATRGDDSVTKRLGEHTQHLQQALQDVGQLVGGLGEPLLIAQWQELKNESEQLLKLRQDASAETDPEEVYRRANQVVSHASSLLHLVGEVYGLYFDPDPPSYLLIDLRLERSLRLIEEVGRTRGRGAAWLLDGGQSEQDRVRLRNAVDRIELSIDDLQSHLKSLERAGETDLQPWRKAEQAVISYIAYLRQITADDSLRDGVSAAQHVDRASAVMDALDDAQRHSANALQRRLNERLGQAKVRLTLAVTALVLGIMLLAYFSWTFAVSFGNGLRQLQQALGQYAKGNLTPRVQVEGQDEVAHIGLAAEQVAERLSNIVSEMRSSAMRLSQTGEAVAASAASLADRTDEQARQIVQTVEVVSSLSQAAAVNAEASGQLSRTTEQLKADALASGQIMDETVHAMVDLESSSRKAGEVIGVIDGIAFQTNILALNAAVEAARAGEAGRGFAVVAGEVRALAQRSAQAAAEVRRLLDTSKGHVEHSSRRLQEAGRAISGLVDGVMSISIALKAQADSSHEQSASLSGVAQSVGNLDSLTRMNQGMVNHSTDAALELMDRAGALANDVSAIQLRQGSADEARNLVDRALSLIQRIGLDAAMAEMRQPGAGYVDRDLYVFITDRKGVYRLHAGNPAKEGHRVHEVPGIDGDAFVRDAWSAANGSHWVDYTIVNPITGLPQKKTSYVLPLDGECVLGCGFYRHEMAVPEAVQALN